LDSDEHPISESADLPFAFETIVREKPDALIDDNDPLSISKRAVIVAFAADDPFGGLWPHDFAEVSRPITYGPSIFDAALRAISMRFPRGLAPEYQGCARTGALATEEGGAGLECATLGLARV
jgi:hypothetical protein